MTPSPEAIDIYRLRELIRTAATLREPNWRSMLTPAGEAAQAELKEVWVANLRYRGSVEDRVHQLLSQRLEAIHTLFGQIPDTLEDIWVQVAQGERAEAEKLIDRTVALSRNPFDAKYSKAEDVDWETSTAVLDPIELGETMRQGW